MNRVLIYSTEQLRLYDLLEASKHPLVSMGYMAEDFLGLGSSNVAAGFAPTYNSNLTITFGTGRLYTLQVVDATIYGGTPNGLAADPTIIAQAGENPSQTLTFSTASLSSGQALYALVEVSYVQTDVIDAADPTSGLLTYLNPGNPLVPWIGQNNSGLTQPTTRAAQAVLTIKYGAAATSGAQVPPTVDSGNVPLYLVTLSFGQTSISSTNVVVAGPSAAINVPSNYPAAPFIAGLLNSHHSGTAGQAPQIKLVSEVQGTLPLVNLPATDTTGVLPTVQVFAGNPNTNVAGKVQDFVWDSAHFVLWECTTTGNAASAVWKGVSHKTLNNVLDDGSGNVTINNSGVLTINGAAATFRELAFQTGTSLRWTFYGSNAAESGSNVGTDLAITRYSDSGVLIDTPFRIIRATGEVVGAGGVPSGVTGISGIMTVMFTSMSSFGALTLDGANHTLNIGTAYPNAKIAILLATANATLADGVTAQAQVSFAASGTPISTPVNFQWTGSAVGSTWRGTIQFNVPLTTGANPSFVYNGSGGAGCSLALVGIIE